MGEEREYLGVLLDSHILEVGKGALQFNTNSCTGEQYESDRLRGLGSVLIT